MPPAISPISRFRDPSRSLFGALNISTRWRRLNRLWEAGRKDEAVFFFYLGQLRFRARLIANPNGDPTGERALYDALMSAMGPPINQYAFGDMPALLATIDRVIA